MKAYFQDDWITIFHADCLDVLPGLDGVGAVVTDPPYSSGGAFRGDRVRKTSEKYVNTGTLAYRPEFAGDHRDQRGFLVWCTLWLNACRLASEPGAVLCSFIDWRQLPTLTDAVQCGGWTWRNLGTWWKPGIRMMHGAFSSSAEYLVYGTNGPADYEQAGTAQNVFRCAPVAEKEHIAEKPEPVLRWALSVVKPGAVILDPFMGIGTTLRAAKDLGHRAIGIEVDERYCEAAAKRMAQELLPFGAQS